MSKETLQTTPALPITSDSPKSIEAPPTTTVRKSSVSIKTRRARNLSQLAEARQSNRQKKQAVEQWREDMTHQMKVLETAMAHVEEVLLDTVARVNAIVVPTEDTRPPSTTQPEALPFEPSAEAAVDFEVEKEEEIPLDRENGRELEMMTLLEEQEEELEQLKQAAVSSMDTTPPLTQRTATRMQTYSTLPPQPNLGPALPIQPAHVRFVQRRARKTRGHQLW
jgi:hypothetical protein